MSNLKKEWIGIGSKLPQQTLLQVCEGSAGLRIQLGIALLLRNEQIFAEGKSEHVQILAAIPEGGEDVCVYFTIFHILWIDQYNAVNRLNVWVVVDVISFAQISSDLEKNRIYF